MNTDIGEPLAAAFMFASMRLLASMGTDVNGQGAALDETLVTIAPGADVRPVIGVYTVVPDEVRLAIELLQCGVSQSTYEHDDGLGQVSGNYLWA